MDDERHTRTGRYRRVDIHRPPFAKQTVLVCRKPPTDSVADRYLWAKALGAAVRAAHPDLVLGAEYLAWQHGDYVHLSFLPAVGDGPDGAQTTLWLHRSGTQYMICDALTAIDSSWAPIAQRTFRQFGRTVVADRDGCDLVRELVIDICRFRGVEWDDPAGPSGEPVRPLCEFHQRPSTGVAAVDWSRCPELDAPAVEPMRLLYHEPLGVAVLLASLTGAWPAPAFDMLRRSLEALLPGAFRFEPIEWGIQQLAVLLAVAHHHEGVSVPSEVGVRGSVLLRAEYAIARALLAASHVPTKAPAAHWAHRRPEHCDTAAFSQAFDELVQRARSDSNLGADTVGIDPGMGVGATTSPWSPLRHQSRLYRPQRWESTADDTAELFALVAECERTGFRQPATGGQTAWLSAQPQAAFVVE